MDGKRKLEIAKAIESGMHVSDIAKKLKVGTKTVYAVAAEFGLETPRKRVSEAEKSQIAQLAEQGLGSAEIGRLIGRPDSTVWHQMRKLGVDKVSENADGCISANNECDAYDEFSKRQRVFPIEALLMIRDALNMIIEHYEENVNEYPKTMA